MATAAKSAALRCAAPLFSRTTTPLRRALAAPLIRRSLAPSMLVGVESLMPLHSAVAAARLKSLIAVESTCWTCLSRGLNKDN